MAKTVTVHCTYHNGRRLRLFKEITTPDGSLIGHEPEGYPVFLKNGPNPDVNEDFMRRWLAAHGDSDEVRQGVIWVDGERPASMAPSPMAAYSAPAPIAEEEPAH